MKITLRGGSHDNEQVEVPDRAKVVYFVKDVTIPVGGILLNYSETERECYEISMYSCGKLRCFEGVISPTPV